MRYVPWEIILVKLEWHVYQIKTVYIAKLRVYTFLSEAAHTLQRLETVDLQYVNCDSRRIDALFM